MSPSYLGSIWMFAGNFAPISFQFCNGALISIAENDALFALLGTTYGGDGVNSMGLPDLRGRAAISQGQGPGLPNYVLGQPLGTETITLTTSNMASHTHLLNAGTSATVQVPVANLYVNNVLNGTTPTSFYSDQAPNATLIGNTMGMAGSSIPIEIVQPITVINYLIATQGIFPTQN